MIQKILMNIMIWCGSKLFSVVEVELDENEMITGLHFVREEEQLIK